MQKPRENLSQNKNNASYFALSETYHPEAS